MNDCQFPYCECVTRCAAARGRRPARLLRLAIMALIALLALSLLGCRSTRTVRTEIVEKSAITEAPADTLVRHSPAPLPSGKATGPLEVIEHRTADASSPGVEVLAIVATPETLRVRTRSAEGRVVEHAYQQPATGEKLVVRADTGQALLRAEVAGKQKRVYAEHEQKTLFGQLADMVRVLIGLLFALAAASLVLLFLRGRK